MTPTVLRGVAQIAAHLGWTNRKTQAAILAGTIPTFRAGGTPYATPAALDDWRALYIADKLPRD